MAVLWPGLVRWAGQPGGFSCFQGHSPGYHSRPWSVCHDRACGHEGGREVGRNKVADWARVAAKNMGVFQAWVHFVAPPFT